MCLVEHFDNMFSVFKQHYTYFHILFYLHVFQKNINNIIQTTLSNGPNFPQVVTCEHCTFQASFFLFWGGGVKVLLHD